MDLTVDLEKTLTNFIIISFTLVFIYIACWTKVKIEENFRKHKKKLKITKTKVNKTRNQEIHLVRKALLVTSNRHQRSIVAASLLQTYEEELERLQHLTDTINHTHLPKYLPGLQRLSSHALTTNVMKVDTPAPNSFTLENCLQNLEKKQEHKWSNDLQSKLCKTWQEINRCDKKREMRHQWNSPNLKTVVGKRTGHKRPYCKGCSAFKTNNNDMYHNVYNEGNASQKFYLSQKILNKTLKMELFLKPLLLKTASLDGDSHTDDNEPCYDVKTLESCNKILNNFANEKHSRKCSTKKTAQSYTLIPKHFFVEKKTSDKAKVLTATIYYKNIKPVIQLNFENKIFIEHLFNSDNCIGSVKPVLKNAQNHYIIIGKELKERIKFTLNKVLHVYLQQDKTLQNYRTYNFNVPLKVSKMKIMYKLIFCFTLKYRKKHPQLILEKRIRNLHYYKKLFRDTEATSGEKPESILVVHSENVPGLKRHSIYTNSSSSSTILGKERTVNKPNDYTQFVLGDNQLPLEALVSNDIDKLFYGFKKPLLYFSECNVRDVIGKVMLKEHVGMAKNFIDFYRTNNDYHPESLCLAPTLETIEEESEDGLSDEVNENFSGSIQIPDDLDSKDTIRREANLFLKRFNDHVTRFFENTKTIQNKSILSHNQKDENSQEEGFREITKKADLDKILMLSLEAEECQQKTKTLICSFDLHGFSNTYHDNTPNYSKIEEIDHCSEIISMNLQQKKMMMNLQGTERLTVIGQTMKANSVDYTDDISKQWDLNKLSTFVRDTEKCIMTASVVIEAILPDNLVIRNNDKKDLQNSKVECTNSFVSTK